MKTARNLLIEVKTLHKDEYITRARQLLRDDVYREIYITDEKKRVFGMIDITDVLKVTDTRSNVTVTGFINDAAAVPMDTSLEDVAAAILAIGSDSTAVTSENGDFVGIILLRDLFPILVSRHEITGAVSDYMTGNVVCSSVDDSIQKVYSRIIESGYSSLPIVKNRMLIGIVSRRDLIENGGIRHSIVNSAKTTISRVMTTPVITTGPDARVSDAARLLVSHDISRVPVVEKDEIVGILDRHDVLQSLVRKA